MKAKRFFSTLCLLAVACFNTVTAQQVGDEFENGTGRYKITSINPNEVKLIQGKSSYFYFNTVQYNNQEYTVTSVGSHAFTTTSVPSYL